VYEPVGKNGVDRVRRWLGHARPPQLMVDKLAAIGRLLPRPEA
jgi:hypothetical protein